MLLTGLPVSKEARAVTIGTVLTPTFIPGFSLAVDYYRVKMTNAIIPVSYQNDAIQNLCLASAPSYNSPFCSLAVRPTLAVVVGVVVPHTLFRPRSIEQRACEGRLPFTQHIQRAGERPPAGAADSHHDEHAHHGLRYAERHASQLSSSGPAARARAQPAFGICREPIGMPRDAGRPGADPVRFLGRPT